jgi:hypothetical protein
VIPLTGNSAVEVLAMSREDQWLRPVRGDPVAWLLEEENPSARYGTLVDLLGQPADDRAVLAARQAIAHMRPVQRILDAQWPEGYWMHPDTGYSPRHRATVWQIIFLAQLSATRSQAIERALEYVLSYSRLAGTMVPGTKVPEARFSAGKDSSTAILCLNGNLLRALTWFGYGDDPRVRATRTALTAQIERDGLRCCFNGRLPSGRRPKRMSDGLPCAWGAIKVLGGLLALAAEQRTDEELLAVETCIRFLHRHDPVLGDFPSSGQVSPLWLQFGFPLGYASDLLELLEVLLMAGGTSPRLGPAISVVLSKQDEQGRWLLEHTPHNGWASFGRTGQPNKWVTLRALRVLKLWGEMADETGIP